MARIVLAEDHLIFREGLTALLNSKTDLSVVAETGDGLEALDVLQVEQPDILIVDLSLPGLDGLEVTRRTKKISPSTRIIILSMHASDEYVVRAFRNGAHACSRRGYHLPYLTQITGTDARFHCVPDQY